MERYIGMDAHAASCTLAVISDKGRKLRLRVAAEVSIHFCPGRRPTA